MKVLFDTSVLVAAMVASHPRHSGCLPWLQAIRDRQHIGAIAAHTLAESYAVLTRLPLRSQITGNLAQRLLSENLVDFEVISLTVEDYQTVIETMVQYNVIGGEIYDALIAHAAVKSGVEILLTLNPKHFIRLGEEIETLVQVP